MQDKVVFDQEKISLIDFKMIKVQVSIPEIFDISKVVVNHLDNTLKLGFDIEEKLAKADFTVSLKTDSKGGNESEATGNFHLIFIYRIENLEEFAKVGKNNRLNLYPGLANVLSSVTYSTSRGILLTRLQGTAFQNFFLPIINPNKLLNN